MTSTENQPRGSTPDEPTTADKDERHLEHVKAKFEKALGELALSKHFDGADELIKAALKLEDSTKGLALHPKFVERLTELWKPVLKEKLRAATGAKAGKKQQAELDKQAKDAAEKYIKKQVDAITSSQSGTELIERCAEVLEGCQVIAKEIPTRLGFITQVTEQIKKIQAYEFIKGVIKAGALQFNGDISDLAELHTKLEGFQKPMNELIKYLEAAAKDARPGDGKDDVRKGLLVDQLNMGDEYFPTIQALSYSTEKALSALTVEVVDTALSAYIRDSDPVVTEIDGAKKVCDTGITATGALLKKTNTSGVFIRLASLISSIGATVATKVRIEAKKSELGLTTTAGDVFEGFDRDPTLLAKNLQANQRAALEILINSLGLTLSASMLLTPGVAETVMTLWDAVASGVTMAVNEILEQRMEKAVQKLKDEGLELLPASESERKLFWGKCKDAYEETYANIESSIKASITKHIGTPSENLMVGVKKVVDATTDPATLTDILGTTFDPGSVVEGTAASVKFNPIALETMLLRIFMPPIMKRVYKFIDVPPAEVISGVQLTKMLDDIEVSKVPLGTIFGGTITREDPKPLEDITLPKTIGGRGVRRSNASRSTLTDGVTTYYVSLDFNGVEVWGRYDPALETWAAAEVDPGSFIDWEPYRVSRKYVRDGRKIRTDGRWLKVSIPEYGWTHYAFRPEDDGKYLWGHEMDNPDGPKGRGFSLSAQVSGFAGLTSIDTIYTV